MISKNGLIAILAVIVVVAIGILVYERLNLNKLQITEMGKEGTETDNTFNFTITVKIRNVGSNDVSGAELVVKLLSDHQEIDSRTVQLGTLEAGWEYTQGAALFADIMYQNFKAVATVYLGNNILDEHTLQW